MAGNTVRDVPLVLNQQHGDDWWLYHADCIDVLRGIPEGSLHYTIFSPPFQSLYVFSDDPRDVSNNSSEYGRMTDDMPEGWEQADSIGSYDVCVEEMRRRHVMARAKRPYETWTPEILATVERRKREGEKLKTIAREFGISPRAVWNARWRHGETHKISRAVAATHPRPIHRA